MPKCRRFCGETQGAANSRELIRNARTPAMIRREDNKSPCASPTQQQRQNIGDRQRGWNSGENLTGFSTSGSHEKERPRLWPSQRRPGHKELGGNWWLQRRAGSRRHFHLELPIQKPPATYERQSNKTTNLVIDDNKDIHEDFRKILTPRKPRWATWPSRAVLFDEEAPQLACRVSD